MKDAGTDNKAINEVALDHAWKWFEYHATQRMTMIRFYVVAAGGIAAGTGFLLTTSHENILAGGLSILGAITSLAFKRLDKRTADLVKAGEQAMSHEQAKIGAALDSKTFEICRIASEKPRSARFYTYGENFRLLFRIFAGGFTIVAIISFARFAERSSLAACIWRYIS